MMCIDDTIHHICIRLTSTVYSNNISKNRQGHFIRLIQRLTDPLKTHAYHHRPINQYVIFL